MKKTMEPRKRKSRKLLAACLLSVFTITGVLAGCSSDSAKGGTEATSTENLLTKSTAENKSTENEKETKKADTEKIKQEIMEESQKESGKADAKAASELETSEQETEETRTELAGYMSEEKLPELVEMLELKQTDGQLFGEFGQRYEGGGVTVEWQPASENNPKVPITLQCNDNGSISIEGICSGMAYVDAKNSLLDNGWHSVGTDKENPKEFYMEKDSGESFMIDLLAEDPDGSVSGWIWCNWPQGDFTVNE